MQLPGDRPAANPRATRSVVLARNGIVATSQPLASAAGLRVLQQGGNAIDAAVTAAAVLSVVEPTMNGVGGDLSPSSTTPRRRACAACNASGRAPAAATLEEFRRRKLDEIPYRGVLSVSVPGRRRRVERAAVEARHASRWRGRSSRRSATRATGLPSARSSPGNGRLEEKTLAQDPAAAATFLPAATRPRPATSSAIRDLATTLDAIARGGRDAFYRGADRAGDRRRHEGARRTARPRPTWPRTARTGSLRSRRPIAATRCSSCRRTRKASSRSRC